MTILVADDDEFVRGLIAEVLERAGYDVIQAESGMEALRFAAHSSIDAFILDVEMPGMTGIELCRQIRSQAQFKVTPILIITGADAYSELGAAFAAGCDDFIGKPIDIVVLRARLSGHLKRMEYAQQLERMRRTVNQYLSRRTLEIVETVSRTGTLPPPEERELAICFTDIRGFTAFSEDIEPSRLFSLVSSLLGEQVAIVHNHGGYIDKFGGDGVMAIFDGHDMVLNACLCALEILDSALVQLKKGGEGIYRFGIGIHTGRAVIGNIGSPEHLDYSAIGTTVNLAARLCGHAEAASIVVSNAVRIAVADDPRLAFHSKRSVTIRGIKEPVVVYALEKGKSE